MTAFLALFLVCFYSLPKIWAFSPPKSSYCHAIQSACCKETKTTAKRMKNFSEEHHGDQQVEELDTPKQGFEQIPSNPPIPFTNNNILSRRSSIASAANFLAATAILSPTISSATSIGDDDSNTLQNSIDDPTTNFSIPSITIPLQYQPNLSAYTISYTIGKSQFGAIIDTGSPFLLVPAGSETSCRPEYKWGCFHPEESQPVPGLEPTLERFDGNEGVVQWRQGEFSFYDGKSLVLNDERSTATSISVVSCACCKCSHSQDQLD